MKSPYKFRDMQSPFILARVTQVLHCAREVGHKEGTSVDTILIEEIGHTLEQEAWLDRSGWYVTFRCDPLTVGSSWDRRNVLVSRFLKALSDVYGVIDKVQESSNETTDHVHVFFSTGSHSIGD